MILPCLPKVSVVIPVYNTEKYLTECLDSVTNQTYTNIEILCVDDDSSDDSLSILKKYSRQDSRITILTHNENKGLSSARNTAIAYAGGEYIAFIDSDDTVDEQFLEILVEHALKNESDVVLGGRLRGYFETSDFHELDPYFMKKKCIDSTNLRECYQLYYPSTAWGKLFNKKIFEQFLFNPEIIYHEDNPFNMQVLISFDQIGINTNAIYYCRIHNDSITANPKNVNITYRMMALLDVYKLKEKINTPYAKDIYNTFFPRYFLHMIQLVFDIYKKLPDDEKDIYYRIIRDYLRLLPNYKIINGLQYKKLYRFLEGFYRNDGVYRIDKCIDRILFDEKIFQIVIKLKHILSGKLPRLFKLFIFDNAAFRKKIKKYINWEK